MAVMISVQRSLLLPAHDRVLSVNDRLVSLQAVSHTFEDRKEGHAQIRFKNRLGIC